MKKTSRAFTLIELLVVVAIIAILSSVVVASLSTSRQKSRDTVRVQNIKQIQNALELYRVANGSYPATLAELAPTHIESIPSDPAGNTGATCRAGSYCYFPEATFGYHLGAQLERSDAQVLRSDADAADSDTTGPDFAGTDPVYDVRP